MTAAIQLPRTQLRRLIIHEVGAVRSTPGGNRYLECQSHMGRVAVRGSATNMRNIQALRQHPLPCDVLTMGLPCDLGGHAWYVHEDSELHFLVR